MRPRKPSRSEPPPQAEFEPYAEFDLAYRPHSYADVTNPPSAILGVETSDELPPLLAGEVPVARITYHTVVPHKVEIRARHDESYYWYRIVDDPGSLHVPSLDRSEGPLSLRQLVKLIEESHGITGYPGLVEPVLDAVFPPVDRQHSGQSETPGDRRARIDAIRGFVQVRSDIYAELEELYQLKTDEWLEEQGYLDETSRRSARRALEALASEGKRDSLEAEIDRLMRAWWLTHPGPFSDEHGIELGTQALRLRGFLRDYAARHAVLPAGEVRLILEEHGSPWTVDLNRLVPTDTLLERMLGEGEVLDAEEIDGWPFDPDYVTVYRFGDAVYVAHPAGVEGPFDEEYLDGDYLNEFFHEYIHDHAELVAQLHWDSGGPGAGAGISFVYRAFGAFYVSDDFGLSEPYDDYEHAVRWHGVYTINDATTRIWDAEHGLVFERGVLHAPEAVARYGEIMVPLDQLTSEDSSDRAGRTATLS